MGKILFNSGGFQVTDEKIVTARGTSIFYDSISTARVYEGKPFKAVGIVSAILTIPGLFLMIWGRAILGPFIPSGLIVLIVIPAVFFVVLGNLYKVQCLLVSINGYEQAVFKANNVETLEEAKRAIELAKSKNT